MIHWLPVLFSVLSILAFYVLAQAILKDRVRAALATAFLAVTPGVYRWLIMGGGLTRALGALFLLLSAYAVLRLFEQGTWKKMSLAVLTCSLAVLSHPEIALHTVGTGAIFWLFYGRTRRGTLHSLWILNVILRFGLEPFLSTLHTGLYGSPILVSIKKYSSIALEHCAGLTCLTPGRYWVEPVETAAFTGCLDSGTGFS